MACVKDDTLLERYLDGELPEAMMPRVESALESCEHCQATLEELSTIRLSIQSSISEAADAAPLDQLWGRLEAELDLGGPAAAPRQPTWRERVADWWENRRLELALGSMAAACAVLVAVWVGASMSVAPPSADQAPEVASDAPQSPQPSVVAGTDKPERSQRRVAKASPNNRLVVESTEVREGVVVIDVDPDDPGAPAIVWHLVDEELEEG